jgi:hypothetical protein
MKNKNYLSSSNKSKNNKIKIHSRNIKSFDDNNNEILNLIKFSNKNHSKLKTNYNFSYDLTNKNKHIIKFKNNIQLKPTSYQIYENNRNESLSLVFSKSGRFYYPSNEIKYKKNFFNLKKKNNNKIINFFKQNNIRDSQTQTESNFNKKNNNILPKIIPNSNAYKLNVMTINLLKEFKEFKNK